MPWHSIKEAQELTGKSRRTLYRDMATGRISWGSSHDGNRQLETSELLRVYGPLKAVAEHGTDQMAHAGTPNDTLKRAEERHSELLELLRGMQLKVDQLEADLSEMKRGVLLLEHKPDTTANRSKSNWWGRFKALVTEQ